jgi:hypothetical protein
MLEFCKNCGNKLLSENDQFSSKYDSVTNEGIKTNEIKDYAASTQNIYENKEGIINQIGYQLDIYHNQLNANKEKFENYYNDKMLELSNYRNAILSTIGIIFAILALTNEIFKETTQSYLPIVLPIVISGGLATYLLFTFMKQRMNSKLLNIQKTFHDGYTTINFMKSFMHTPVLINQLDSGQLITLNKYHRIIQGGIAQWIRRTIQENIGKSKTENDFYGKVENNLFSMLIENAHSLYDNNNYIREDLLYFFEKKDPKALFHIYDEFYLKELKCNKIM